MPMFLIVLLKVTSPLLHITLKDLPVYMIRVLDRI